MSHDNLPPKEEAEEAPAPPLSDQWLKRIEDKKQITSRISELTRFIGYGLVAAIYAMLVSDSETMESLVNCFRDQLLFVALSGVVCVAFDYIQFMAAYFSVQQAIRNEPNYLYKKSHVGFKLRNIAFWVKQIAAIVGSFVLGWVLYSANGIV